MELRIRGQYAHFENKLLTMNDSTAGWELISRDLNFVQYGFIPHGLYCSYIVQNPENIRAFSLGTACIYKNGTYSVITINVNNNNTVYMFPDEETSYKLGLNRYDDMGIGVNLDDWKRDVEEITQRRYPIEGFIFDVPPIVYIKKKDEPYDEEKWERINRELEGE
jgi:hypothetical protein